MSERLSQEVARLAGRLAGFLEVAFPRAEGALAQNVAFLRSGAGLVPAGADPSSEGDEPLDHLTKALKASPSERDLLVFSGMAEEHEGYAAVLRTLHPRGEPRPTLGLAAQLFGGARRSAFLSWFHEAPLVRQGAVRATGECPFFERSLELPDALWPALHGCDVWPAFAGTPATDGPAHGLQDWLASERATQARQALLSRRPCTILVTADSEDVAYHRALALARSTERTPAGMVLPTLLEPERWRCLKLHALLRSALLVLRMPAPEGQGAPETPQVDDYPDGIVLAGRTGAVTLRGIRPLMALPVERLSPTARRAMWRGTLPALSELAPNLAARYAVEPSAAAEVAADLACLDRPDQRAPHLGDVADAVRARATVMLGGGVKLIRPTATWDHLVLSRDREAQLRAAIARLELQAKVLDDWGFLRGRPGARGVRMLFSGPPGTGKTLSAEVVAGSLRVDVLFVDISRVVSKWIGETEKNLAAVFDTAERAQAVLFFDEADALFGRRTEVSDAHDRYANLETAYLLARLERFEGLAILATNLRQNIDPAFLRRLEFVVEFDEPDRDERHRLWRCHVPDETLLDPEVNLAEFAALYPVVGGFIRNAAVAAAFLAASDGGRITRAHLLQALRREYEKSGKAFPGLPAGTPRPSMTPTTRKEIHVRHP
ncbi:MAG: ATP-binding protein [Verrucomicrobiae bacterium]|nr:ATP-binding protein [Verrucomicrobiae bacterium]